MSLDIDEDDMWLDEDDEDDEDDEEENEDQEEDSGDDWDDPTWDGDYDI